MKFCRSIFVSALLLISFASAFAQQTTSTEMSEADRAKFDQLRREGFEALYSLDYEGARVKFKELAKTFPDHPAGPQFLAAALWGKVLNESRRLQSSLYNSDSFYSSNEDKPDPAMVAEFRDLTRQAKLLEQARLKRNPKDIEALYFLGATEGIKAAFEMAVQRSFIGALKSGSSAVDRHHEVLKLDPNFHDAELTIGMYDYVAGSLPLPVKLLASIGGVRGSKKRGLETLLRVAHEGKWAQDDARAVLIVLLKREKRYADALTVIRELGAKYPRNYLFKLEAADALMSIAAQARAAGKASEAQTNEREAHAIFDSLLHDRALKESAARAQDLIHYRYGESLLNDGQPENAAREFLAAASAANAQSELATLSLLRAAQSFDLAGKRNEAITRYRAVLDRPNVYDSHDEAKQGLKEPYKPKPAGKSTEE